MDTGCYRRFSNKEALKWGIQHYSDWMVNIQNQNTTPSTPAEQFFRFYTQGAHTFFNKIVRCDNYLTYDFSNTMFSSQMFTDSIAEIQRHKIDENIVVYRYIPRTLLKSMLLLGGSSHVYKDAYLVDNGYMSTTLSLEAANGHSYANSKNNLFTIYVPKGTSCVFVDLISDMNEREMLFAPGTKLKVLRSSLISKKTECIIIND